VNHLNKLEGMQRLRHIEAQKMLQKLYQQKHNERLRRAIEALSKK
jgi:hypothetical protein